MIIQFSHDGNDLKLNNRRASDSYRFIDSKSGYRYWNNTNSHKRKFMRQKGHYLRNLGDTQPAEYKEVDIYFWGEWEPQSKFELTDNDFKNSERLPHAVHFPIFSKKGIGQHNTDPFVFGDIFCYTNCKQKIGASGTRTGKLDFSILNPALNDY